MSIENEKFVEALEQKGFLKNKVLYGAFREIDRIDFVPLEFRNDAYLDLPIPIGFDATTSQPSTIAFMLEKLQPKPGQKVLEIGTGSGYLTALLSRLVGEEGFVISIEYVPELRKFAQSNLKKYGFKNIKLVVGDGKIGFASKAPFDVIVSSAEADSIPAAWEEQLAVGGRLLTPLGSRIILVKKISPIKLKKKNYSFFDFVKLK